MNILTHKTPKMINNPIAERVILFSSYVLNVPVWLIVVPVTSQYYFWIMLGKIVLAFITGMTTMMAFMNQYKAFKKNFKTLWIVVTVNHVFTFLKPKKRRQ